MRKYYTEQNLLQTAETLFETLKTRKEIADELTAYSYDSEKINQGKQLYEKAKIQQETNRNETKGEIQSYEVFEKKYKSLVEIYKTHRKKVKIIFKNEPATLKILAVTGIMPMRMLSVLENIEVLYTELDKDANFKAEAQKLKITQEEITQQINQLAQTKTAYAQYISEKGESQQATKDKNKAFSELEKWIREFYIIAKIALEQKPQLLESLGKYIKS